MGHPLQRHRPILATQLGAGGPFFAFAPEIQRIIYTTNAIKSLNMTLRRAIKTRSSFPTDEAVLKLLFLALRNAGKSWKRSARKWRTALNQFAIMFGD